MKTLMRTMLFIIVAVVAIAVAKGANFDFGAPSTAGNGGSSSGGGNTTSPGDGKVTPPDPGSGDRSTGTVFTTFRGTTGSGDVACGAIDSEFKVVANDGDIRWTAEPRGGLSVPHQRAGGVVVQPSSGTLKAGQSQLVHVRGSFTGSGGRFMVYVGAPNDSGSGGQGVEFSCR